MNRHAPRGDDAAVPAGTRARSQTGPGGATGLGTRLEKTKPLTGFLPCVDRGMFRGRFRLGSPPITATNESAGGSMPPRPGCPGRPHDADAPPSPKRAIRLIAWSHEVSSPTPLASTGGWTRSSRSLGERTWPEMGDAGRWLLAVPLGSCEQHGPH